MATATIVPANVSADWSQGAVVRNFQASAAITSAPGKVARILSTGKIALGDANVGATEDPGSGLIVSADTSLYGDLDVAADGYVSVCLFGPVNGFSGLTVGARYYVSETAGELTTVEPASNAHAQAVGIAVSETTLFVNPHARATYYN